MCSFWLTFVVCVWGEVSSAVWPQARYVVDDSLNLFWTVQSHTCLQVLELNPKKLNQWVEEKQCWWSLFSFLFYYYVCTKFFIAHMSFTTSMSGRWHGIPWDWSYEWSWTTVWVLGTELWKTNQCSYLLSAEPSGSHVSPFFNFIISCHVANFK